MNLYEEIELQEKERIVDSLATENQMLQEPKTPTKEQLEKVWNIIPAWILVELDDIESIICAWEKIRNQQ